MKAVLGDAVRAARVDEGWRVSGYLVRFTGPEKRDLYREWFDRETDFLMERGYPIRGLRVLFNHGMSEPIGVKAIGRIEGARVDVAGLFVEALIDEQDEYVQRVMEALSRGELGLGWSSGSLPQAVRVSPEGHVDQWAIVEASLTHVPAMPFDTAVAMRGVVDLTRLLKTPMIERMSEGAGKGSTGVGDQTDEQETRAVDKEALIEKVRELMDMLAMTDIPDEDVEALAAAAYDEAVAEVQEAVEEKAELLDEAGMPDEEDEEEALEEAVERAFVQAAYRRLKKRGSKAKKSNVRSIVHEIQRGDMAAFRSRPVFGVNVGAPNTPIRDIFLRAARMSELGGVRSSVRAQNPEIGALGGYLLGQQVASEILPELRAKVVAFNAGVRSVQVAGVGSYVVPKNNVAPAAYRPGINDEVADGDAQFDVVVANMRPIASRVAIPRQMLLTQAVASEEFLRDEMVKSIRLQIDKEIFIGVGAANANQTGAQILGIERLLRNHPTLSTTNVRTLATNGRLPVLQDLEDAITQLYSANVEQNDTWCWVFHPRIEGIFRSMTDTTGQPLLRGNYGDQEYERLLGIRKLVTTQIPVDRTTGTNTTTSLVFAGRFDMAQYVMSNQIEVLVDEYSQSKRLQVVFTAYTFSDFIVDYPEAFYVIDGVDY